MSNFDRGGRKARGGISPSMGLHDPRRRTNAVHGRTGDDLGQSLTLDREGRMAVDIEEGSGLTRTPDGKLTLDKSLFQKAAAAAVTLNTTVIGGGGSGGGSGGDTTNIFNTFILDDTLNWLGW